jgi:NADPH-dependent glutamate synthase beta subunit-like oxidoreductase
MTAIPQEVYEAEEEGVRVMYLVSPVEVMRDERGQIRGVLMRNNVLGVAEHGIRRPPEAVDEAVFEIECDTVIVAISQHVDECVGRVGVPVTSDGTLQYEARTGATPMADIVAAGDASMGPATVIRSIAEGFNAAVTLDKNLRGAEAFLEYLPETHPVDPVRVIDRNPDFGIDRRVPARHVEPDRRKRSFEPYESTMTREEAVKEAGRCLFCGCGVGCQICEELCLTRAWIHEESYVKITAEDCVACGICIYRCPNDNIDMVATALSPKNSSEAGKPKVVTDPAKIRTWSINR